MDDKGRDEDQQSWTGNAFTCSIGKPAANIRADEQKLYMRRSYMGDVAEETKTQYYKDCNYVDTAAKRILTSKVPALRKIEDLDIYTKYSFTK